MASKASGKQLLLSKLPASVPGLVAFYTSQVILYVCLGLSGDEVDIGATAMK